MKTAADQAPGPQSSLFERAMDGIHRGIVSVDKFINKVIPEEFNPFYYLERIDRPLLKSERSN